MNNQVNKKKANTTAEKQKEQRSLLYNGREGTQEQIAKQKSNFAQSESNRKSCTSSTSSQIYLSNFSTLLNNMYFLVNKIPRFIFMANNDRPF